MKLKKYNWILIYIAALYFISALWAVGERFITALLSRYAPVEMFSFSYIGNTCEAVLFGALIAAAFGLAAAGSDGKRRLAFRLAMSARIVLFGFFLFYILFSSTETILFVDLALVAVYGGLEAAAFVILAVNEEHSLRLSAILAAITTVLTTAASAYQILSSIMLIGKGDVIFWISALSLSGTALLFLSVTRGVTCGLYFTLVKISHTKLISEDSDSEE